MSTHSAVQPRMVVPPMAEMVDSLAASASSAFANFESRSAQNDHAEPMSVDTRAVIPQWAPLAPVRSTSRLGKGGAFALVVLGHALVFYVLANLPPQMRDVIVAPLQVALLSETPSTNDAPPPPPVPRMQQFELPVEPLVIDITVADTNAITVAAKQTESAPALSSNVGTPKVVSSVEYLREPNAKYPPTARALKQRGIVTLRALIDTEGHAREVNVHRSSGYRLLDDAARNAVLNALFKPYTENGRSQPVYVFIPIEFGAANS